MDRDYMTTEEASKLWKIKKTDLDIWSEDFSKSKGIIPIDLDPKIVRKDIRVINIYWVCSVIVVISLIISLISCAIFGKDEYISYQNNYTHTYTEVAGVQIFLFLLQVAVPFIMKPLRCLKKISPALRGALIILLTVLTIVFITPHLFLPGGGTVSHGRFLGYSW